MEDVAERLDPAEGDVVRDQELLEKLRQLLFAISHASHLLRLSSYSTEDAERLLAAQRKKVG